MKRFVAAAALMVVAILALLLWLGRGPDPIESPIVLDDDPAPTAQGIVPVDAPTDVSTPQTESSNVDQRAPIAVPPAGVPSATLRGRVLDGPAPVPSATVRVMSAVRDDADSLDRTTPLPAAATVTAGSDGEGRFVVVVPVAPGLRYDVHIDAPGFGIAAVRLRTLAPDADRDFGDIALTRLQPLAGRVVDADDGTPRAGLEFAIHVGHDPIFTPGGGPLGDRIVVRSGGDGAFRSPMPPPARPLDWTVVTPGFVAVSPRTLLGTDLTLKVARLPLSIRGRLDGNDGRAIARMPFTLVTGSGRRHAVTTDDAGRFELFAAGDPESIAAVRVGLHEVVASDNVAFGRDDARIVIRTPGALIVRALDEHGVARERFLVRTRFATYDPAGKPIVSGLAHPDGTCRLEPLPAGPVDVLIEHGRDRPPLFGTAMIPEGGTTELDCMPAADSLEFVAVDSTDTPLDGIRIDVGIAMPGPPHPGWPSAHSASFASQEFSLATGTTDPQGLIRLRVPSTTRTLHCFFGSPQAPNPLLAIPLATVPRDAKGRLRVVVDRTDATLRFHVTGLAGLRTRLGDGVTPVLILQDGGGARASVPLAAESGQFPTAPTTDVTLHVAWQTPATLQPTIHPTPLAVVRAGSREVTADVAGVVPLRLRGTVHVTTPGNRATTVDLRGTNAQGAVWWRTVPLGAHGEFEATALTPANLACTVTIVDADGATRRRTPLGVPARLERDGELALRVADVDLRLRLLWSDGTPINATPVLVGGDGTGLEAARSDDQGVLRIRPAPVGDVRFSVLGQQVSLQLPAHDGVVEETRTLTR